MVVTSLQYKLTSSRIEFIILKKYYSVDFTVVPSISYRVLTQNSVPEDEKRGDVFQGKKARRYAVEEKQNSLIFPAKPLKFLIFHQFYFCLSIYDGKLKIIS